MPDDSAKVLELADGLYVRQAVDNMGWIDLGGFAAVVDALEQPSLELEVLAAIGDTLGDVPIRYVLNTHTHGDHVALNPAFERRGAEVVSQRTADIPPDGRWFEGAKRRVQMLPMAGAHTAEDCVVWVPDARVLFAGDLFGWGVIPVIGNLTAERVGRLLDIYERLIAFEPETLVGGHGPLYTPAELRRFIDYIGWLRDEVARAGAREKSEDAVADAIPPPDDMRAWWRFVDWKHADTVRKVARAVRRGDLA